MNIRQKTIAALLAIAMLFFGSGNIYIPSPPVDSEDAAKYPKRGGGTSRL